MEDDPKHKTPPTPIETNPQKLEGQIHFKAAKFLRYMENQGKDNYFTYRHGILQLTGHSRQEIARLLLSDPHLQTIEAREELLKHLPTGLAARIDPSGVAELHISHILRTTEEWNRTDEHQYSDRDPDEIKMYAGRLALPILFDTAIELRSDSLHGQSSTVDDLNYMATLRAYSTLISLETFSVQLPPEQTS